MLAHARMIGHVCDGFWPEPFFWHDGEGGSGRTPNVVVVRTRTPVREKGPGDGFMEPPMNDLPATIESMLSSVVDLRHHLHAHPELGFEEHDTARRIAAELEQIDNLDVRTGVAKTGIVATLNADKPGKCVALRADMDGLTIEEETGLPYASKNPGHMHACGHDGHMACLVGAAKVLSHIADDLPGKVKFIFQPAEEGRGGGNAMRNAGVLDDPTVDAIFAMHGWPELEFGVVGTRAGPFLASQDSWEMTVHGTGGHAAWPHLCVDPIVAAAHIITAIQTIVSRSTDPLHAAVVTVGEFNAGTAHNIIPATAELTGTIRALDTACRTQAAQRLTDIAEKTAAALGARADVRIKPGYPVLVNDPAAARLVMDVAGDVLGPDKVAPEMPPCMGAEDFAYYAEQRPAAFWCLGTSRPDAASAPRLHQPTYDFPDALLPIGIRMHCEITRGFLGAV